MAGHDQELWLPAEPRSAARARSAVRELAQGSGLQEPELYDLTLATSEAVANAVEHGSPCGRRGVRMRVSVRPQAVTVEVCDCGGFRASERAGNPERGRGLPIIGAVCDQFEVVPRAGRTIVRFGKQRGKHRSGRQAAFA
jgi:serine/threonine-protein kinase RsbW